jgi:hypothetical protein
MGKVLPFKRIDREFPAPTSAEADTDDLESYIGSILGDCSLTVANRYWILENLLMDLDDQLEEYRRSLEVAEKRLELQVQDAERQIAAAYFEFNDHVSTMTQAVKRLTINSLRKNASGLASTDTGSSETEQ